MEPYENICSSECFHVKIWNDRVEDNNNPKSVVVDHTAYWLGNETDRGFRGFGGAKFKIKFYDGRYIESTNLWHNGDVPEEYWDRIPNNAEFIKEKDTIYSNNLF